MELFAGRRRAAGGVSAMGLVDNNPPRLPARPRAGYCQRSDADPHSRPGASVALGTRTQRHAGQVEESDPSHYPASERWSTDKLIAQHTRHDFNRTGQADGRGVTEERQRSSVRWQNNKQAEAQNSSQERAVCQLCGEGTQVLGRLPSCS